MKHIFLTLLSVISIGSSAFAGTARQLSLSEERVVAVELAKVIPNIVNGNEATLTACQLNNVAAQGQADVLEVLCEYTALATKTKADVVFDKVTVKSDEIQSATFKSLTRQ